MRDTSDIVVREYRTEDRDDALRILTQAFADAPDMQVMVGTGPASAHRRRRLFTMAFAPSVRPNILVAEVDSKVVGVLTWAEMPACSAVSLRQTLTLIRVVGPRLIGAARMFRIASRFHPATPHRHVIWVGVDPELQGRGAGSALVSEVCGRCDADGMPAYLETFAWSDPGRPSLRALYERFGFSVTHEIPMDRSWSGIAMLRPARVGA